MSTSLIPVPLPAETWVDIYDSTGLSIGTKLIIQNRRSDDVFLSESASAPTGLIADIGANPLVGKQFFTNLTGNIGAWAYSIKGGLLQVEVSS